MRTSMVATVYKPTIRPTLSQQYSYLYPQSRASYRLSRHHSRRSHALRILSAVSAFVKLFESLFWLSLLLEATHNHEDNSTHTLTVVLATAFVISMVTGLVAMFSPCFEGHFLYKSLLTTTVCSFVWNIIILALCFILGI
ncbi:unnamed protein product, partial [Medioppia subpectinata]